jgi:histidine ammonia-lyase
MIAADRCLDKGSGEGYRPEEDGLLNALWSVPQRGARQEVAVHGVDRGRGDPVSLCGDGLTARALVRGARWGASVVLDASGRERLEAGRATLERLTVEGRQPIYGVNTGFGRLATRVIDEGDVLQLQKNLARSHAAGCGEPLDEEIVRGAMLVRANTLAKGFSGVRPIVVERLLELLNARIHPVVPRYGSLGASGDLVPLAHVALVLQGEGHAAFGGRPLDGADALSAAGLAPLDLASKEGLALVNGTSFMTATAALALDDAVRLLRAADIVGACTLSALNGSAEPFAEAIHAARPHPGQQAVARNLRALLAGLPPSRGVQDAYSLRCMPQVHGAVRDAVAHAVGVAEIEMNAATDNPLVFPRLEAVLSGGNFHGAPVAHAVDYAKAALADLLSISERRTNRLLHPDLNAGLPPFLAHRPGLESGWMLGQYTAAAMVARARVLAQPSSIDSIPVSGDQEDHVSMGLHAALDLREVVDLGWSVLAVELLCAAAGIDHRGGAPEALSAAVRAVRDRVPASHGDAPLDGPIGAGAQMLRDDALTAAVAPTIKELI